ncbi:MAG: phage major capsid protein [Planctomycetaceae bacterium]|nr:phage major capsid protein [Planctomycetaceae bacterium]
MSAELKKTIEDLGTVVHEFKQTVDTKFESIEQDRGIAELEAKLDKMNDAIDSFEDVKKSIEAIEAKGNRINNLTEKDEIVSEHKSAFNKFVRKGAEDGLLDLEIKATDTRVSTDASGGYAVPEELDTAIGMIEREASPMRGICGQRTVSNDQYKKLFSLGGAASGWVAETAARTQTNTPDLAEIVPTFGEIYANPAATQKSLDDLFFNVEEWLAEEVGREFAEKENLAFTVGDGSNKPTGFLDGTPVTTADASRAFGVLQYRASTAAGALGSDDAESIDNLIDMTYDIRPGYRNGSQWVLGRDVLRAVRKLRDTNGDLIWNPGLQSGQPSSILDYPFTENEDMPDIATDSFSLAFGNFTRGYTCYDVVGTRVLRDPFTNKPYVHFYTTKRVGGFITDSLAIKLLKLGVS